MRIKAAQTARIPHLPKYELMDSIPFKAMVSGVDLRRNFIHICKERTRRKVMQLQIFSKVTAIFYIMGCSILQRCLSREGKDKRHSFSLGTHHLVYDVFFGTGFG
jgi:hypothetical protein